MASLFQVAFIDGGPGMVQAAEHARMLFAVVGQRVRAGLMTPTVCVSYGGELDELRTLPGYAALREVCASHGVTVYESVMSLTGMVNVGKGAVTVGFADGPHRFE